MTTRPNEPGLLRRRLPLLMLLGVVTLLWKGGFGFFATSRDVTWRIAVPYGEIRKVELQLWRDDRLLRREERMFPAGVSAELKQEVVLRKGVHQAIAKVWIKDSADPHLFRKEFDPEGAEQLALDLAPEPNARQPVP